MSTSTKHPRVKRVIIRQFLGIEELDVTVAEHGIVISGGNRRGKTSFVKALKAALLPQKVTKLDESFIRRGANESEILVDIDDVRVRRRITPGSAPLTVVRDKAIVPRPAEFLAKLIGLAAVDPLDLFLTEDPTDRRSKILKAIPLTLTIEQLGAWLQCDLPPCSVSEVGRVAVEVLGTSHDGGLKLDGDHALVLVERLAAAYRRQRTGANKTRDDDHVAAADEANMVSIYEGRVRDARRSLQLDADAPIPTRAEADTQLLKARTDAASLLDRQKRQAGELERRRGSEERIEALREQARQTRQQAPLAPPEGAIEEAYRERDAKGARVEELRAQLRAAEAEWTAAGQRAKDLVDQDDKARRAFDKALDLDEQARTLEQALGAPPAAITEEHTTAAAVAVDRATWLVTLAANGAALAEQREKTTRAQKKAEASAEIATRLDGIVKTLDNVAPAELLASAHGIAGLAYVGGELLFEGSPIEHLSGEEMMRFSVEVARRLNAEAGLLICDGLERIDGDNLRRFIELATADGFQLICTMVADGDVQVEAIQPTGEGA